MFRQKDLIRIFSRIGYLSQWTVADNIDHVWICWHSNHLLLPGSPPETVCVSQLLRSILLFIKCWLFISCRMPGSNIKNGGRGAHLTYMMFRFSAVPFILHGPRKDLMMTTASPSEFWPSCPASQNRRPKVFL